MSHEPEPIVIDRRHPAWVAAFAAYLATCSLLGTDSDEDADAQDLSMRFADASTICIMQKDTSERAAYEQWKAAKDAKRRDSLELLAVAMYQQHYYDLAGDMKDVVSYTLSAHGDDLQKALASLADDFDPLADIPCPSVTPPMPAALDEHNTGRWKTLDDMGFPTAQWERNKDKREGRDGNCIRCGLAVDNAHFFASYTTNNFLIPTDLINEYPTEGAEIPERFADFVKAYGSGLGLWPVGPECAKIMAGYVTPAQAVAP